MTAIAEEKKRSRSNKQALPLNEVLEKMTVHEKYDCARKRKDQGNAFFRDGCYENALERYRETIAYVRRSLKLADLEESKTLVGSCYSNMAACALKMCRFEEVIQHATDALCEGLKGNRFFSSYSAFTFASVLILYLSLSLSLSLSPSL